MNVKEDCYFCSKWDEDYICNYNHSRVCDCSTCLIDISKQDVDQMVWRAANDVVAKNVPVSLETPVPYIDMTLENIKKVFRIVNYKLYENNKVIMIKKEDEND